MQNQVVIYQGGSCCLWSPSIFSNSRAGKGFRRKHIDAAAAVCSSSCPAVPWFVGLAQTRSLRCSGQTQTNTPQPLLFLNKKSTSQQNPSHFSNPICCRVPQAVTKHGWRDLREARKSPLCKSWIPAGSRGNFLSCLCSQRNDMKLYPKTVTDAAMLKLCQYEVFLGLSNPSITLATFNLGPLLVTEWRLQQQIILCCFKCPELTAPKNTSSLTTGGAWSPNFCPLRLTSARCINWAAGIFLPQPFPSQRPFPEQISFSMENAQVFYGSRFVQLTAMMPSRCGSYQRPPV